MANELNLSLITSRNPRTAPIIDGQVRPFGINLTATVAHPSEIFWRQLHNAEFDVSEMSISSLLIAASKGDTRYVGIPIFSFRRFFHVGIYVRTDRGIETVADLKGKKVGVPEYQQTAALWARGVLRHEFGVMPEDFEWYMERTEQFSHGGATGFTPPPSVRFNRIPAEKNIGTMMDSGELDATLMYLREKNLVDRSQIDLDNHPKVRLLFPDPQAEGARFFQKTGIYPINHCMVVRRSILEQHPWVAVNLYNAFTEAKERAISAAKEATNLYFDLGMLPLEKRSIFKSDPMAYGVQANKNVLDTITQYSYEQGLTPRRMSLSDLFAPNTLEL